MKLHFITRADYMRNPYFITTFVYLIVAAVMSLSSALGSITGEQFFEVLAWTRIHYITIGGLVQFMIGFLPMVIQRNEGETQPSRWDIWILLNIGFVTFLTGRTIFHDTLIITGGLLLFVAITLFVIQVILLANSVGSFKLDSGEIYYITGIVLFLLGIIVGTGIWANWSSDLRIAVPLEVHIHANNWGFASFIFTGLFLDLLPYYTGKQPDWRINPRNIYILMLPGAVGLIFGPWIPSQWVSVPGLVLHLAATIAILVNSFDFVRKSVSFSFDQQLFLFTGYLWFLAPVFVAPLIVFKIGDFSSYDVEGFAPEALVYGWLLTMLIAWIYLSLSTKDQQDDSRSVILPLVITHLGSILLWTSIFTESEIIYGLAYLIWAGALVLYLLGLVRWLMKSGHSDDSTQLYSSTLKYLSMFFAYIAVGFYLLILSGEIYAAGTGPQVAIPILGSIGFFLGGSLIVLQNRKLIQIGLIINPLIFFVFFIGQIVQGEPLEAFGLLTKVNQVILELVLLGYYRLLN